MGYQLSVKAAEDIEQIWLYTVENWSLAQADRYINLIIDEIEYLANHPASGKDCSHIRENYRSARVKSHVIFYRAIDSNTEIEVIRILHQSMDIENHLND